MEKVETVSVELTPEECNVIIHALDAKRQDPRNSKTAKKSYENMYVKMFEKVQGEGTYSI